MSSTEMVYVRPVAGDAAKASSHREIARRYAWDDRERSERGRYPLIVAFRLRDLEDLFAYRYGPTLPDDDAGRGDLYVAASHIYRMGSPETHIPAWARLWAPWLGKDECDTLIADVMRTREHWTADALGALMRLDDATRTKLGITTIAPIDYSKAKRAKRTKLGDAAYQTARRAKAGATSHTLSAARTKPWEVLGISERTYYRKKANGSFGSDSSAPDRKDASDESLPQSAWPSGQSAPAGLVLSPAITAGFLSELSAAAALEQYPAIETKRDSTVVGRLGLHWIKKGKNPFNNLPLQALESTGMDRAAA
jgi:hypothetical protein